MNYIILDFNGIKSLWTLHEYFKEVFNLPDYYGHNMDALWDCLDCSFEFPTTIVLKNIEKIPSEMNEATEIMLELFEDLQRDNEKVTVQIESNDFGDNSAFIVQHQISSEMKIFPVCGFLCGQWKDQRVCHQGKRTKKSEKTVLFD